MIRMSYSCSNCGNTTGLVRTDEDEDLVVECLVCEERELFPVDTVVTIEHS
jgi:DNA-directed RNA polymerase subunit RPC12/RpoP